MNTIFVAKASPFMKPGKATDKNGAQNLWLSPIAGKIPNRALVLNGTIAQREQVFDGDVCLFQATEGEVDPKHGRQFSVTNLGRVSALEMVKMMGELGDAVIIDTNQAEAVAEDVKVKAGKADAPI